ncbi:response regulator [Schinkia azotoformans]|uniref:Response regulator receiver and SARP domain-containing protein n=1 Tax=Schinkia azotoformans LMG 9581 TaxID=1131731 RepID=K6BZ30_SCHAZ|nr:response regulator [Schinkia azotoformans]EKN64165.1 response regulator receiver and SARP domain-containing protein [Schinkia azotoformans LMG 9581]MEC1639576.1 response regulator [Schinkia azotoformans]MEC1722256.1 response regulator [Schinkia azotoformans]MEC1944680.1 response regulator [Schinkia azotoformans]MED4414648.1 response regulator [Schinkia azotoformans]
MLRVLIIDDEILAITLLEKFIEEIDGVQIIGKYTWFEEGLESFKDLKPDVVFLDIEMPSLNGIEIAERIAIIDDSIDIVFVTAYDHYALEAFRVHAVDYLLKPTDKERLKRTLHKIMKRRKIDLPELQENPTLHAQLIGNFILYDNNGQVIKWRTKKVKELCAYLLHHGNPIHRMQIIEDLWPDVPLEKAGALLHTTVYQLRKILKSHAYKNPISFVDERYSMNINILNDLESLIQIIEKKSFDDRTLLDILEVVKKGFLGYEDYQWSFARKQQIDQECKQFLEHYVNKYNEEKIKPKQWGDALEALIELEPFVEKYYQELIKFFINDNEIKKAVGLYKDLQEILWSELGEIPNNETKRLVQKYLK